MIFESNLSLWLVRFDSASPKASARCSLPNHFIGFPPQDICLIWIAFIFSR